MIYIAGLGIQQVLTLCVVELWAASETLGCGSRTGKDQIWRWGGRIPHAECLVEGGFFFFFTLFSCYFLGGVLSSPGNIIQQMAFYHSGNLTKKYISKNLHFQKALSYIFMCFLITVGELFLWQVSHYTIMTSQILLLWTFYCFMLTIDCSIYYSFLIL